MYLFFHPQVLFQSTVQSLFFCASTCFGHLFLPSSGSYVIIKAQAAYDVNKC